MSLVILGIGGIIKGPFFGADSAAYLTTGEKIIDWLVVGEPTFDEIKELVLVPYYAISSTFLSAAYMALDEAGVMALNSILYSIMVCLVFSIWRSIYGNWHTWGGERGFIVGALIGLYVVFGLPDAFLWSNAVLTDIIFLFWVTVFVVATTHALFGRGLYFWFPALFVAMTGPFVRPTGIVLPLIFLYALCLYWLSARVKNIQTVALVSFSLPAAFVFLVYPWLVLMEINQDPMALRIVPDFLQGQFLQSAHFFEHGIIISNRYEIDLQSPPSYLSIVHTIVSRLAYYWIPLRLGEPPYSVAHNIVNLIYMIVGLPMFLLGVRALVSKNRNFSVAVLFLVVFSFSYSLLHSITLVSFDWRYQLPAMVPLWILCGCGFFAFLGYEIRLKRD